MNITYDIVETGRNVRLYIKENHTPFWDALKPLLPWIIGFYALDMVLDMLVPLEKADYRIGALISSYFYSCFCITCHRIILWGPYQGQPVNPFNPEKTDLAFIGMGIGLFLGMVLLGVGVGVLAALTGTAGLIIGAVIGVVGIVFFIKAAFYFPAKAVKRHMSLTESFTATNGYILKLMGAPFVAVWRLLLAVLIYAIAASILAGMIVMVLGPEIQNITGPVVGFLVMLPMIIYFQPLLYALSIGVLSNYYQHSIQNRPVTP